MDTDTGIGRRLVLGSGSPRRVESGAGVFGCVLEVDPPARPEESRREGETPVEMVSRLSRDKAEEVAEPGRRRGCVGGGHSGGARRRIVGKASGRRRRGSDARGAARAGAHGHHRGDAAGCGTGPDEDVGQAVGRYDASVLRRGDLGPMSQRGTRSTRQARTRCRTWSFARRRCEGAI